MAEVKGFAKSFFVGIRCNNTLFDSHTLFDERSEGFDIKGVYIKLHELWPQFGVDESCLEHFSEAAEQFAGRERLEPLRPDECGNRGCKTTDGVFESVVVKACLSSGGGIYHREEGGGDIDIINTTFVSGCSKADKIGKHASSDSNH